MTTQGEILVYRRGRGVKAYNLNLYIMVFMNRKPATNTKFVDKQEFLQFILQNDVFAGEFAPILFPFRLRHFEVVLVEVRDDEGDWVGAGDENEL